MDATTLDPQAWPLDDTDLELPTIGLELAEDVHRFVCLADLDTDECDAACAYFTGPHGSPEPVVLLGTSVPGEIELDLNVEYPNVEGMDWTVHEPEEDGQ
jgi:hypothetical protein